MNVAFRCRIQYSTNASKLKKFFEDAETLTIAAGKAGMAFYATSPGDECYYMIAIHTCDIYRLHVDTEMWGKEGVVRSISAIPFISFIRNKETDDDLVIEIDKDAIQMNLHVMDGSNVVRSASINMTVPDVCYEYPIMLNANAVLRVNEFKKLCADMSKESKEIMIEHQEDAIRITAGKTKVTYGSWLEKATTHTCYVKNTGFVKATKMNIGIAKNSLAGIYITPDYPLMIKAKLGLIDFMIYSKKWFK